MYKLNLNSDAATAKLDNNFVAYTRFVSAWPDAEGHSEDVNFWFKISKTIKANGIETANTTVLDDLYDLITKCFLKHDYHTELAKSTEGDEVYFKTLDNYILDRVGFCAKSYAITQKAKRVTIVKGKHGAYELPINEFSLDMRLDDSDDSGSDMSNLIPDTEASDPGSNIKPEIKALADLVVRLSVRIGEVVLKLLVAVYAEKIHNLSKEAEAELLRILGDVYDSELTADASQYFTDQEFRDCLADLADLDPEDVRQLITIITPKVPAFKYILQTSNAIIVQMLQQ